MVDSRTAGQDPDGFMDDYLSSAIHVGTFAHTENHRFVGSVIINRSDLSRL